MSLTEYLSQCYFIFQLIEDIMFILSGHKKTPKPKEVKTKPKKRVTAKQTKKPISANNVISDCAGEQNRLDSWLVGWDPRGVGGSSSEFYGIQPKRTIRWVLDGLENCETSCAKRCLV